MKNAYLARSVAGALTAVLAFAPGAHAADTWVEVTSPHFTVISDAGERAARSVAFDWEQLRVAIHSAWPWARLDLDRPIVVIAVKNEDDMKAFAPQYWEERGAIHPGSVGTGGPDQLSYLIRADLSKDDLSRTLNPYFGAYWQYVSTVLGASLRRPLPLWFSDGVSAVMANSIVGGSTLQIGKMMEGYVSRLHNGEHPTIPELMKIDRNSPWYARADARGAFDAMSWAFTHYLLFGDEGAHRQKFQEFVDLLVQGKGADDAFAASLGDPASYTAGFAAYINRMTWPFSQLKADMSVPATSYTVRTLPVADSNIVRARFHVEMGREADARAALDAVEKANPQLAAAYDVEAVLADRQQRGDEAMKAYARAVELGSTSFYSYYRWASANINAAQADTALRAKVTAAAEHAAVLNKLYPPALALLANVSRMNGNKDDAVAYATRAVELAPGDAGIQRVLDNVKR